MGQFTVPVTVHPPESGPPIVIEALVDTGAAYSVMPEPLAASIGYRHMRSQAVVLADGRAEDWPLVQMDWECGGRRAISPVLLGPVDSSILLGAVTLQLWSLGIDPVNHLLMPVRARL